MTRDEFIKEIKGYGYRGWSYRLGEDEIEFHGDGDVWLDEITTLPPGVEFKNRWHVRLNSLETLPPGGVEFNNGGKVQLNSLRTIHPGVEFKNGWDVNLESLVGGWFGDWKGNIEGVDSKRLLNLMIKQGVFR